VSFGKVPAQITFLAGSSQVSVGHLRELVTAMIGAKLRTLGNVGRNYAEQRPPIVLTASDHERLLALVGSVPTTGDMEVACFLREEIERADVAPDHIASNSVVRLGCDVKFVDHAVARSCAPAPDA